VVSQERVVADAVAIDDRASGPEGRGVHTHGAAVDCRFTLRSEGRYNVRATTD
jgi:hypothetical protein